MVVSDSGGVHVLVGVAVDLNGAGCDDVASDAVGGQRQRQRAGEAVDPALGGGVYDVLVEMHVAVDRADVDDAAGSPFDHVTAGFLAAGDHGDQVDVEDVQPILGIAFEEGLAESPAGVVDEDVQLTVALDCAGHDATGGVGVAEVGLQRFRSRLRWCAAHRGAPRPRRCYWRPTPSGGSLLPPAAARCPRRCQCRRR